MTSVLGWSTFDLLIYIHLLHIVLDTDPWHDIHKHPILGVLDELDELQFGLISEEETMKDPSKGGQS